MNNNRTVWLSLFLSLAAGISALAAENYEWVSLGSQRATSVARGTAVESAPAVSVDKTTGGGYRITLDLPGFRKRSVLADSTEYNALEVPEMSTAHNIGEPAVPVRTFMLEIPHGVSPRVSVAAREEVKIDGLDVLPAQPLPPDVYPEPPKPDFVRNAAIYDSDRPYPADNILSTEVVGLRNRRLLVVQLAPIRVLPESRTALAATHLALDVELGAPSGEETGGEILPPFPEETTADANTLPIYMILMDDQFTNNKVLADFVDWKKRKGYDVRLVKTSDINANGAPTNSEIVAYMRGLDATNYPAYLLILGDHTASNGVAGAYFNSDSTNYYGYTDLDIACRTNTDWIPDIYCGRIFATNNAAASNILSKVYAMDRSPPTGTSYQKVCVAGQIQDSDDYNDVADRLFCETADLIACYFEQKSGYTCTRAIVNPDGVTTACYWNAYSLLWNSTDQIGQRVYQEFVAVTTAQQRMSASVNSGVGILQHRDHGYVNGVGWADPQYLYTHVNALTNGVRRPVVFSINCNSGMYNYGGNNNFARAWLQNAHGGAYAVFAPVDTSYSWCNDWMSHGFYAAFLSDFLSYQNTSTSPNWSQSLPAPGGTYGTAGSRPRLGQILNFGKLYMYEQYYAHETTFRLFHLFGDPESYLQLGLDSLSVSHSAVIPEGTQSVTITTGEADCDVALYSSSLGIHQRITTTNSEAVFTFPPVSAGTIYVTVTKFGKRPYEGTILAGDITPLTFRATALTNSVMLRWTDPLLSGVNNRTVHVRVRTDDYPSATNDGAAVYTGTNVVCEHTGLTANQPYYYTIWVSDDGINFIEPP